MAAIAISPRITVLLEPEEQKALRALCEADRRPPKWTLRHLVMEEAERRGWTTNSEDTGRKVSQASPVSSNPQSHKATAPLVGS